MFLNTTFNYPDKSHWSSLKEPDNTRLLSFILRLKFNQMGEIRSCKECEEVLRGRIDQKFCSDQCRTTYNNRINRDSCDLMRKINYILRRNRRILKALFSNKSKLIRREELLEKGFNFQYHTKTIINKEGKLYVFCYDLGYVNFKDDKYFLISQAD
jgi:hypothetical protein